ncbi:NAD(P)-binding protein [Cryphonectria parasitica EP155]|uniref:NAD(P)-binding protein n=1 Tax=Cryphonectria parasitica (strain ATCC 38755 / EP155) TaxID=660469 RepID=A0A9P4XV88_CRYP1|nr:NAD(P)-binding protein [Cryphonectria parasitica EP155]KAF3761250.1 NAD(P)-binding protein [Cryphonectria parasitica EP155]
MPNTLINFSTLFSGLSRDKVVDIVDQWFPPKPTYTETSVARQDGRVFIITGGNSGIGLALVKLLYPKGAKIYIACRSEERAQAAIKEVLDEYKTASRDDDSTAGPPGSITYMHLDLDDLATIKSSAAFFAEKESRLDILWNNAGIAGSPIGTKTKQGIEGHIGINCVAPLLFTQELLPQLRNAASQSPPGATRVVWTASLIIERFAPEEGVDLDALNRMNAEETGSEAASRDYAQSKAGNWLLGVEGARRWGHETEAGKADAIVSVTQNPGMITTPVWKHQPGWLMTFLSPTFYPAQMGAYTMLYAGFSNEVSLENNGAYVLPFGRLQQKSTNTGIIKAIGNGKAKEFWEWCEQLYGQYAK